MKRVCLSRTISIAQQVSATNFKKVVVVGGGAMGSLYAAKFAIFSQGQVSSRVWLLSEQKDHIKRIQKTGYLELHSLSPSNQLTQKAFLSATGNPAEINQDGIPADFILVFVKNHSLSNKQATKRIRSLAEGFSSPTLVVNLQNGMSDSFSDALAHVPNIYLSRGITSQGAYLKEPGEVVHAGVGPTYLLKANSQSLADFLNQCRLECSLLPPDEFQVQMWKKLLANCVINPLTAIYDIPNGELLEPTFEAKILQIINEVKSVTDALAIDIGSAEEAYKHVMKIAKDTSQNVSSMRADVRRKSVTEIESLNGYVISQATRLGLKAPLNLELMNSVLSLL